MTIGLTRSKDYFFLTDFPSFTFLLLHTRHTSHLPLDQLRLQS